MANTIDPNTVALQGCLRQALRLVLPRDEVEVAGQLGRVERLHEDRTCTVSFPEGRLPPGLASEEDPSCPEHEGAEQRVVAVEVRAGVLIDLIRFRFADGSTRDHGQEGGALAGRFELEEGETLTRITGSSGDSLDSVQFHTSSGRSSQVFGNAGGGRPFTLAAPEGRAILGVRRGAGNCAAIRGLICSNNDRPAFRPGQRVIVQGLASTSGQALNGLEGVVTGRTSSDRLSVDVDGHGPKALKAENLVAAPGRPVARVLLRDCRLRVPRGNFSRRRRYEQDVEVLRWRGRCDLGADGRARVQGGRAPPVGREGVHHVLRVVRSEPLPEGAQVTSVKLDVVGMDQGWGNSGDSGVVLYLVRAGNDEVAAPWLEEEPLAKVIYDRRRHPGERHSSEVSGLFGPLAPQPGDRLEATLHCPNYPGWSAHVQEVVVSVHCLTEKEEPMRGELPEAWEAQSTEALQRLRSLREDSFLAVDASHLSLRGQERQHVWDRSATLSVSSRDADVAPVVPRLKSLCRGRSTRGAEKLLGKLDANTAAAGAPQDPQHRKARYGALRGRVHRTLDALAEEGKQGFLETVFTHYAEAADSCIYRWDREISNMHDLVTGESTGSDALQAEDAVLQALCDARRQLAEAALHRAKGAVANSDMHFENYFYGSIHFGLPEQLVAAKDPNRLNYGSLNMLQPADVQRELTEGYTPAAIRGFVRARVLESTAEGSQAVREKLHDWMRGSVPPGFQPEQEDQAVRQEAWLFEQCHDADFRMRDWALNFMLCGMHVLRADRLACLLGDPGDTGPAELLAPSALPQSHATARADEPAARPARGREQAAGPDGGRCVVQ